MLKKSFLMAACLLVPFAYSAQKERHAKAPVLTGAQRKDLQTIVTGTVHGKAKTAFLVQFFNNQTDKPQGESFLQQITVRTDDKGKAHFKACLPCTEAGSYISATATQERKKGLGETSEFSNNVSVHN